uniref:Uncharacterized protein n=1 Tax=Rhizophora mucronata TaxID=61149 RepID=A0A2P2PXL7_RHIMU
MFFMVYIPCTLWQFDCVSVFGVCYLVQAEVVLFKRLLVSYPSLFLCI